MKYSLWVRQDFGSVEELEPLILKVTGLRASKVFVFGKILNESLAKY